jgi:hypothetical protein
VDDERCEQASKARLSLLFRSMSIRKAHGHVLDAVESSLPFAAFESVFIVLGATSHSSQVMRCL